MRQFTSVDAQFIAGEDGFVHGHVVGLAIYEPRADGRPVTGADVRRLVGERIHLIPPFRRRVVRVPFNLDLPYWVDDPDFHISHHIVEHELPAPGDDRVLARHVAEVAATPLDLARPPWMIHVIGGLDGDRVAVATAIHHSASDGIGMAQLFATLHDPSPQPRDLAGTPPPPERVPSPAEMLVRGLAGLPRQPVRFLRSAPRALPHLDQVVTLRPMPGIMRAAQLARRASAARAPGGDGAPVGDPPALAPRTRTTGRVSPRRTVAFATSSLPEIKAVKNHYGVSVNDVVMSIVAGGMRAWLSDLDDLPSEPLAAMVPISVRNPDQDGFENRFAMMIPQIFTDEPDPARRLQRTHETMLAAKERHQAVPATLLQDANHFIPPLLLARAARASAVFATSRRRGAAANVLISNIPGAREAQYLDGARLLAHFPLSAIFHGLGLNVTIVSYGDQVDWGVAGDPAQIGDAWELISRILEAQTELVETLPSPVREPSGVTGKTK